jgi:hypothetical protein
MRSCLAGTPFLNDEKGWKESPKRGFRFPLFGISLKTVIKCSVIIVAQLSIICQSEVDAFIM